MGPAQRGAAILTAMLTVVLVATLAATALWQQWRGVEIEAAQRTRSQADWVLKGALDWARLILIEDARKGGADHLAEPWAVPLEQARLSTFLAADRSDAQLADDTQDAFLSGQIIDMQSYLNVANLVLADGKVHEPSRLAFAKLFDLLNLPDSELKLMVDQLVLAQTGSATTDSNVAALVPLWPQELDQLTWVGLSLPTIERLRPFVVVLPVRTPVNLNTASAEVIYACVEAFDLADANRLLRARNFMYFSSLADIARAGANAAAQFNDAQHSVSTRFFEVRGNLQIDQTTVQEHFVVQRDALEVKTLSRQRGVLHDAVPLQ
jgi:general secretion pathway protein K